MDLNSDAWRDLVFEGKNRKYGAYDLRKTSSGRHLAALLITMGIVVASVVMMLYIVFAGTTDDNMPKSATISDLIGMESLYFENLAQYKTTDVSPSKEKAKSTPPEIVKEEDFTEIREKDIQTQEPVSEIASGVTVDADDVIRSVPEHKFAETETLEDTIVYALDDKDLSQEFQLLRTTVLRYVYQYLKYPEPAYKQRIRGRVVCSFIVNENGAVSDVALVSGVYIFLDEEVLRVLRSMPACEPQKKDNKPIKVKCYLPIVFSL